MWVGKSSAILQVSLFWHKQSHTVICIFFSCAMHYNFHFIFLHSIFRVSFFLMIALEKICSHRCFWKLLFRTFFFKFFEKYMWQSTTLVTLQIVILQFSQKWRLPKKISQEFSRNFKNTYFSKHLWRYNLCNCFLEGWPHLKIITAF